MNQEMFAMTLCVCMSFCGAAGAQNAGQLVFNNGVVGVIEDVNIPARDSGLLTEFAVKLGQRVQSGEVLGELDATELEAQREVIEVEMELAEITVRNDINVRFSRSSSEVSRKVLDKSRQANLLYQDTVSSTEIDRLALEAERGKLSVERSLLDQETAATEVQLQEKRLALLEVQIANRRIFSPVTGMVVSTPFREGEWVERGQTVARVIRTNQIEVVALGDAKSVDQNLIGQPVTIETDRDHLSGVVTFVTPEINPASGQVQIRAEIDNSEGQLRPGSRVKMIVDLP